MGPEGAQEMLVGLAEEALSGRTGEVVRLEAPEWPPLLGSLRRELDGRSVYSRPGIARYATAAQLTLEERLVAHAQAPGVVTLVLDVAVRSCSCGSRSVVLAGLRRAWTATASGWPCGEPAGPHQGRPVSKVRNRADGATTG